LHGRRLRRRLPVGYERAQHGVRFVKHAIRDDIGATGLLERTGEPHRACDAHLPVGGGGSVHVVRREDRAAKLVHLMKAWSRRGGAKLGRRGDDRHGTAGGDRCSKGAAPPLKLRPLQHLRLYDRLRVDDGWRLHDTALTL
tara:strand:- start:1681 stop:2103 length:423 start_codon:yes stop_codon:yes gene_type:complete